ncbi:MAG TPA: ClpXP protease specificity-enhancing factor [Steroidobacteraceae bacterium]|nr:ClpXP protease specificity-enhancing factor [Steroidobacteraceae bacterium]
MAKDPPLTPRRPYLLRAMHEWMTDNGQTPHLVVDAALEGVVVPRQYVKDGKIVLNVGYAATAGLAIKNDLITFSARFSGVAFDVSLPVQAVLGIYARETGQGMIFSDDEPAPDPNGSPPKPTGGDEPKRPQLKVVK